MTTFAAEIRTFYSSKEMDDQGYEPPHEWDDTYEIGESSIDDLKGEIKEDIASHYAVSEESIAITSLRLDDLFGEGHLRSTPKTVEAAIDLAEEIEASRLSEEICFIMHKNNHSFSREDAQHYMGTFDDIKSFGLWYFGTHVEQANPGDDTTSVGEHLRPHVDWERYGEDKCGWYESLSTGGIAVFSE